MLIYLGFYRRRPDLSLEQFFHHWHDVHGPLMRRIADENPGLLTKYVQHHLTPDQSYPAISGAALDFTQSGFDGFSEAWFEDETARDAFFGLPEFQTEGMADEKLFLDLDATRWVVLDRPRTIVDVLAD